LIADNELPGVNTRAEAAKIIEAVVTQDPPWQSHRIWSMVLGVLTAVLAVPEVQALMGPWAPVVTAVLAAGLAGWSKASDPRPTR
jgi:hypothetical protein